jgi:hypothetical protein
MQFRPGGRDEMEESTPLRHPGNRLSMGRDEVGVDKGLGQPFVFDLSA